VYPVGVIGLGKMWIGLGVSVALLALFLLTIDVRRMADALADANYIWVIPAVALYLVSVVFRTLRWRVLLLHLKPVSVTRLFPVVVVGYMANNILPMRLGELVRSYYVGEREGISKSAALATVFVERVLDALTLMIFIVVIALFIPLGGVAEGFGERSGVAWPLLVIGATLPFVAIFGVMVAVARYPVAAQGVVNRIVRVLPGRVGGLASSLAATFILGLVPLKSARAIALLFFLSVPIWLFEASLFYMIGISFDLQSAVGGHDNLVVAVILVTAVANIGGSVPAAPGGIGLFELIARETLVLLPLGLVDRAVAGGYAAVVHAALLLPMILMGQGILWTDQVSLKRLWRSGRLAEETAEYTAKEAGNSDQ
jgi:uncharacterized protein (TIRG00374 family)